MKKIMIVDDNEADQFLNKVTLTRLKPDIEIVIASDGVEALELLDSMDELPDMILLDINMPRMNGHEFLDAFDEGENREIPVVVMLTTSGQERDKAQAMAHKCVKDYLLKPMGDNTVQKLSDYLK